ncbi:MAG TPA: hypothetical protein VIL18_10925 [Longimicrobiales bacterium]
MRAWRSRPGPLWLAPGDSPRSYSEPEAPGPSDYFHDSVRAMRSRSSTVLTVITVILLACGDRGEPRAIAPEPCRAQAVYEQAALDRVAEQDVRVAEPAASRRIEPTPG